MSEAYEGYFLLHLSDSDSSKVWSYHSYKQDCPFGDIRFGELIYSVYGSGSGIAIPDPQIQEPAENIEAISKLQQLIKEVEPKPIPSEHVRICCNQKIRGGLIFSFSTTQQIWNQVDQNCCILLNISLHDFEPGEGQYADWRHLKKILSAANDQQAFRDSFPLQIKQLDRSRLQKLYPKADLKEYFKVVRDGGKECFQNIHVVLKFSRSKTEEGWIKSQQLMGNKLLVEGLLSDFAIKASGKTIPCHRIFLAGRSAVFAKMFESNMTEVENETLTMEDMSAEGVERFLKFVYTGSLVDATANSNIAFEMLRAGHKYEIEDLEFTCKKILESTDGGMFDAATAFDIYQFCGNVDGLATLQQKAVRVLKENADTFKETGEIGALSESIQSADVRKAFNDWVCNGQKP